MSAPRLPDEILSARTKRSSRNAEFVKPFRLVALSRAGEAVYAPPLGGSRASGPVTLQPPSRGGDQEVAGLIATPAPFSLRRLQCAFPEPALDERTSCTTL